MITNMDISRELVDPSDRSSESPGGLVHSWPSEEGSFSRWLQAQKNMIILFTFENKGVFDNIYSKDLICRPDQNLKAKMKSVLMFYVKFSSDKLYPSSVRCHHVIKLI